MPDKSSGAKAAAQTVWKASPRLRRFRKPHVAQTEDERRRGVVQSSQQAAVKISQRGGQVVHPLRPTPPTSRAGDAPQIDIDAPLEANVYLRLNRSGQDGEVYEIPLKSGETIRAATKAGLAIATLTEEQLEEVLELPDVASAEMAEPIKRPLVQTSGMGAEGPAEEYRWRERTLDAHRNGEGVLIGIIDVDGFDFSHPDFLDSDGKTRFARIWDQGADGLRPPPEFAGESGYGSEFTREHLNAAMAASETLGVAPYHIEQQSSVVPGSHGTHVASIAAGNSGVCPAADIAAVLIHLPDEDWEREQSFTDSTRIADAVEYLLTLKNNFGEDYKAVSINISLGTNGHAHDGTSGACRWIESELDRQGRAICVAAGNAGQEEASSSDDFGFIVGRIHTSGRVPAPGLTQDIQVEVVGFPIEDVSENEIEIWYSPQDRFDVSVRPPDCGHWIGPVGPGDVLGDVDACSHHGESYATAVSIYNDLYHGDNGANRVTVFLTPSGGEDSIGRVHPGIWTIRLGGREIRDGRYDGWIERDDPIPVLGLTPQSRWHYPAFFTGDSNVDRSSLSTLATTRTAIAVANLDSRRERIAVTSSQGPTRDGQRKPEVCAPGTDIVAACGFHPNQENKWISMSGTSMASPYVAGVTALMLAIEPRLTPSQIRGIIARTTRPLPGADYDWKNDAGFGRIDPGRCLDETLLVRDARAGGGS